MGDYGVIPIGLTASLMQGSQLLLTTARLTAISGLFSVEDFKDFYESPCSFCSFFNPVRLCQYRGFPVGSTLRQSRSAWAFLRPTTGDSHLLWRYQNHYRTALRGVPRLLRLALPTQTWILWRTIARRQPRQSLWRYSSAGRQPDPLVWGCPVHGWVAQQRLSPGNQRARQ